jgi:uncharacterized membrane protein
MTRTVIESKTKTVIIGFDEPFCVIGERINPTGRKKLAAELEAGNFETVIKDALEQVACGATVLDVNSGAVFTNKMATDPRYADNNFVEPPLMKALIEIIQQTVDVPLCIDSVGSRRAGGRADGLRRPPAAELGHGRGRAAGTRPAAGQEIQRAGRGDFQRRHRHQPDPDVRFAVAKKIVERAADFGIPAHDIVVDPLVMPVGAMAIGGQQVFALVRRLREELGREHHLRRVEHQLRPAPPPRHQRRLPAHGDRRGHDQRHHEPRPPAGDGGDPRRQLPDEPRCERRRMDPLCQGAGSGRGREVFALEFTSPLWVILLAAVFLGERITRSKIAAAVLGFAGILIVARPGFGTPDPGVIAAAASAVCFATTAILTKVLTRGESIVSILFWLTVMQLGLGLATAGWDGDLALPTAQTLPWLALIGACGLLAHFCLTKALSLAPASVVVPIDFARLPVIAAVGFYLYGEALEWPVVLGATLIFLGIWINLRGSHRASPQQPDYHKAVTPRR